MIAAGEGPTVYDVVTAVVAGLSLLLALYGLRRQVKREKRTLKVTCRYSFAIGPITAVAPDRMVTVEDLGAEAVDVQLPPVSLHQLDEGRLFPARIAFTARRSPPPSIHMPMKTVPQPKSDHPLRRCRTSS